MDEENPPSEEYSSLTEESSSEEYSNSSEEYSSSSSGEKSEFEESEEDSSVMLSSSTEISEEENSNVPSNSMISNSDGIDRLSGLPDSILHHILSFLDMKRVVRTSLVSRRWRYLWKFVPGLNFNHWKWRKQKRIHREYLKVGFMNFVDEVMFLLDGSNIQKFHLACDSYCCADRIDEWAMAAARRHVQEVYLQFYLDEPRVLPQIIFTSKIGVIKLKCNMLSQLPDSTCLASQLKTLLLEGVKLPEGNSNGDVVLSCPILENLILTDCGHAHLKILNISTPQLKNLAVENVTGSNSSCKFKISTPNLTSLRLKGDLYKHYSLQNLSSLVNAKLESCYEEMPAQSLINIIKGLHNATTVELSCDSVKIPQKFRDTSEKLLNPYSNLRCLKLIGWSKGPCIPALRKLLMSSPYIESLVLEVNQIKKAEDWGKLFDCICHLKTVDIRGIKGRESELKFFEFLLKNAGVLEEFTAVTGRVSSSREEEMVNFSKKIHSLPRASSNVRILFLLKS